MQNSETDYNLFCLAKVLKFKLYTVFAILKSRSDLIINYKKIAIRSLCSRFKSTIRTYFLV